MIVDHTHEELGREECLTLLRRSTLGRIGVSAGALPHVEPVHFRLVDDEVVLSVGRRTRLDIAASDNVVAFEVDTFDPVSRSGWSIVVTGVARRLEDADGLDVLEALALPRWQTEDGESVLAISTDVLSGQRIHPQDTDGPLRMDRLGTAEVLGLEDCWGLLAAEEVGRLAVIRGDVPLVTPINYAVDGRTIVFRTDPGTKFHQGPRSKVSFEIDGLDHAGRTGWSVVVVGLIDEISEADTPTFERARQLPIRPWAGGRKDHMMRLVPTAVSGRRVGRVASGALAAAVS